MLLVLEAYILNCKKTVIKVNLWYKTASCTMQRLLSGSKGKMYVFINNQETFQPSHWITVQTPLYMSADPTQNNPWLWEISLRLFF